MNRSSFVRRMLVILACLVGSWAGLTLAASEQTPPRVAVREVLALRQQVGRQITVWGRVTSTGISDRSGHHFLNFENREFSVICMASDLGRLHVRQAGGTVQGAGHRNHGRAGAVSRHPANSAPRAHADQDRRIPGGQARRAARWSARDRVEEDRPGDMVEPGGAQVSGPRSGRPHAGGPRACVTPATSRTATAPTASSTAGRMPCSASLTKRGETSRKRNSVRRSKATAACTPCRWAGESATWAAAPGPREGTRR